MDVAQYVEGLVKGTKEASASIARASSAQKDEALEQMARNILDAREELQEVNREDLEAGRKAGLSSALLDRLELTEPASVAALQPCEPDPIMR